MSDRRLLGARSFGDWVDELAAAGVGAVLVREKDVNDLDLLALVAVARDAAAGRLAVLVSGRPDVAVAAGADGVHLTAPGLPTAAVRRAFRGLVLGRSTHHPEEVADARRDGADYVTFGPVHDTPAKRGFGPPQGVGGLAAAVAAGLPVVAIGGVDAARVADAAAAGAAGVAAIRACHDPGELAAWVAAARAVWGDA